MPGYECKLSDKALQAVLQSHTDFHIHLLTRLGLSSFLRIFYQLSLNAVVSFEVSFKDKDLKI